MKRHRYIAVLLVLCLLSSLLSVTVLAEGAAAPSQDTTVPSGEATEPTTEATEPTTEATEPTAEATEAPDSGWPTGSCGSSVTWVLDPDTGTLTVSGSGAMDTGDHPPWMNYRLNVTAVVVGEGVTSISFSAFSNMPNLRTAKLPSTLRHIGERAFSGCTSLQMPTLSDNITTIDSYAFYDCRSITSLTVPAGVSVISWGAFSDCVRLSEIRFHSAVTELEDYAFSGCFGLTQITIPDSVTQIGGSAFKDCIALTEVKLGNGITTVSNHMLGGCTSLQKIVIPDSVTQLSSYAFSGCTRLWDVTLGAGVTSVATTAFHGCGSLSAFKVSESNPCLYADGGVLYNGSSGELVLMAQGFSGIYNVLEGTKRIGDYACDGCSGLTGVTIPGSVREIGKAAFRSCSGLVSLKLGYGVSVIGNEAFRFAPLVEVYFPGSITNIKDSAFGSCDYLKKLTFGGDMPKFADGSFYDVSATGYYPGGNSTWDGREDLFGDLYIYQTFINWVATSCGGKHTPQTDPGVEATCTQDGISEGSHCTVCGQVLQEQKVIPAGHSYGQWEVITPATQAADGLARRSCTGCGEAEEKLLAYVPPASAVTTEPVQSGGAEQTKPSEVPQTTEKPAQSAQTGENTKEPTVEPSKNAPGEEAAKIPEVPAAPGEGDTEAPDRTVTVAAILAAALLGGVGTAVMLQRRRAKRADS